MEKRLVSAQEFKALTDPLPVGIGLVAIRFVNFSSNALEKAEHSALKICEIEAQQPSFFIISDTPDSIRELLHQYVDRFCDLREGKS